MNILILLYSVMFKYDVSRLHKLNGRNTLVCGIIIAMGKTIFFLVRRNNLCDLINCQRYK